MSDFVSREDVAAVPERSSVNTGVAWEGSERSVACSETPVPPASEPSPSQDFGASSLSSEEEQEEEVAPSLPASEEDLTCAKGLCVDVEKDSELSELEPPTSPAPPQQPWAGEEEVAEEGEDRFAFRELNGECHDSDANTGLPAVIRCFQVVSPAPAPLHPLWSGTQTLQQADAMDPERNCVGLASCLELIGRLISHSQCPQAPLNLSSHEMAMAQRPLPFCAQSILLRPQKGKYLGSKGM